jgi:hypothetical protein
MSTENDCEKHEDKALSQIAVSGSAFVNGDKVKYAYGLTFIFIGLDPLDNTQAYCLHPTAICQEQPNLKYKRVDKLPLDRLTHCH